MFKRKKTARVKKVIDVKFEVKEDFEEAKGSFLSRFKGYSNRENRNMPIMDEISKISTFIKKLPRSPQPAILRGRYGFLYGVRFWGWDLQRCSRISGSARRYWGHLAQAPY
ncbi:MAG: hypothetical protein UZ01_02109 [Candidatus Brocadia sinica]|nr:MAG: hypothetical protein UZ01_02109 [Candidatus Brocadia sinica]